MQRLKISDIKIHRRLLAVLLAVFVVAVFSPCISHAADGSGSSSSLQERNAWFEYGFTECTGDVHELSEANIVCEDASGTYYSASMMLCDTDHVIRVSGDGVTQDKVTLTSSDPSVLEIDSEGKVTLGKTGTARITASVAADAAYKACTIYLDVKADRHTGWIEGPPSFADRPASWGLEIDTADGSHPLKLELRPGATATFSPESTGFFKVDQNGVVTPLSAGISQIWVSIDSGGGKYKPCRFGWTIKVSGETVTEPGDNTGDDPGNNTGGNTGTDPQPQDPEAELADRQAWFTYECTDCLGNSFALGKEQIGYYLYPQYFGVDMMMCDTDHTIHVEGDNITEDNLTFTSLDPEILQIDNSGNVTLLKEGKGVIEASIAADNTYKARTIYLAVTAGRHDGWIDTEDVHYEDPLCGPGTDLDTTEGPKKLYVPLRPGAVATFSTDDPEVARIDSEGVVTPVAPGYTIIRIHVTDASGKYREGYLLPGITVTGDDIRMEHKITGDLGPLTIDWHDGVTLNTQSMTDLNYAVCEGEDIATVDQNGHVTFTGPGKASVKVTASPNIEYRRAEAVIEITARDYAAEEAARKAAEEEEAARIAAAEAASQKATKEESSRQTEIRKAKSLRKPSLKVKALKGRKIKITWSKVANADGYILYVKYPGSRKYVKAVTRKAIVKSVTHKGLSKSKVYKYRVRAFKKVKGKIYYSPYSKVKHARVR